MFDLHIRIAAIVLRRVAMVGIGYPKPKPDEVIHIRSRDEGRTIKAHLYKNKSGKATGEGPRQLLINFCGSGFILPLYGNDDFYCRLVANTTPYTVLDVEYRLAPKHPFPAALNDVEDSIKWALSQPDLYDASRLCLSGFSAGGNLALGVTSSVLPQNTIKGIVVFYPVVDLFTPPSQRKKPEPGGTSIPNFVANIFDASYLPDRSNLEGRKDPRISPLFADLDRFPQNLVIVTAGYDNLALHAEELAGKIAKQGKSGRSVVSKRIPQVNHAWDKDVQPGSHEEKGRDEAYALAVDMLVRCAE